LVLLLLSWVLLFLAELLVQAQGGGLSSLKFFGGDSLTDVTLLERIGKRPSTVASLTLTSPSFGSDAFKQQYRNFTSNKQPYGYQAGHAYDAMVALMRAFQAAAAPKDGPAIKAALQLQKFEGERPVRCTLPL
jgi:ABC-type branched-subunit amino acid transport system substrate-binding protein